MGVEPFALPFWFLHGTLLAQESRRRSPVQRLVDLFTAGDGGQRLEHLWLDRGRQAADRAISEQDVRAERGREGEQVAAPVVAAELLAAPQVRSFGLVEAADRGVPACRPRPVLAC